MSKLNDLSSNTRRIVNLSQRYLIIPTKHNSNLSLKDRTIRRETLLKLWITLGSIKKAQIQYQKDTGIKLALLTVRKYAIEYIIFNPNEARKLYQESGLFPATEDGDLEWVWHVINIAVRQIRSKHAFIQWAITHGFYKSGFSLFKDTFNMDDSEINAFDDILSKHD